MPRRNLIPLLLLAVLVVLSAVFAVVGFAAAPTATTIQVQNATEMTFGTPTGATSWLLELITSVKVSGAGGAAQTQERLVKYVAPDRMLVYDVTGTRATLAGELGQPAIACVLSSYTALLQGHGSWQQKGETFTRTESVADYSARVPVAGATCAPMASTVQGQVHETAVIRANYLVATRALVVIPTRGTQGETLAFVRIGDIPVRTLKRQ
jgi:hypothetical protein